MSEEIAVFWFRRDLRLVDNAGLFSALNGALPVQPIFIFDTTILDELEDKKDARVHFIYREVTRLSEALSKKGTFIDIRMGKPIQVWKELVRDYNIGCVYANRDYEPYARKRDKEVYEFLASREIPFRARKDHVIFEKDEILKKDGLPYVVFTPYSRMWKTLYNENGIHHYPSEKINNWNHASDKPVISLSDIGFCPSEIQIPEKDVRQDILKNYHHTRDIPGRDGTSRLSIHLRFGTISIRSLVKKAYELNEKYLNELIWRDFYQSILWHFPGVKDANFSKKYDSIVWRNNEEEFELWCEGKTGYPIVDAGMRQLNNTGYMHNRVRMIVASFLTKHLLIDWRWGEAYFANKLLDFELASNNGGWQWAAGTGVDAAPYFRIFNPYTQTEKFDKDKKYIRKWIPEFGTPEYPRPIVEHSYARERALATYKEGLERN